MILLSFDYLKKVKVPIFFSIQLTAGQQQTQDKTDLNLLKVK